MTNSNQHFENTLKILFSESSDLRLLAEISGFPPESFYNGADLRGVNLKGNDLRGLNFARANLISSNLDDVIFDEGAFNESLVDSKYEMYQDEYELSLIDFDHFWADSSNIMGRARFRPNYLDKMSVFRRMPYRDFSIKSRISINPLRRARMGDTVSGLTVITILHGILNCLNDGKSLLNDAERSRDRALLHQPSLIALRPFGESNISRESLLYHSQRDWPRYFGSIGIDVLDDIIE